MKSLLATAAVLAVAAAPAFAQTAAAPSTADQQFARSAASGGKTEVELGQFVAQHAQNPDVQAFGQRMVTDHTAANAKLEQVAKGESIQLPASPDSKDQATINRIEKLKGAELDRTYIRDMVQDHQKDIQEFQKEAQSGTDPQLKSFAQDTLPTLQMHLQMAEQAQSKIASGASRTSSAQQR